MKKPNNYARFYALLKQVAGDDMETAKEALVSEHTGGRTASLREMSRHEYNAMCEALQAETTHPGMAEDEYRRELKRLRSAVLHRMQRLGIDTSDWSVVDAFCSSSRIAGRKFAQLSLAELELMIPKLEGIARNGIKTQPRKVMIPMIVRHDLLPS